MDTDHSGMLHLLWMLQVWLQSFAWTENSLSAKKDSRSAVGTLQEGATLAQEPRFCFETSVKLLYWCGMAYEYQEVIPCSQSCNIRM